MMTMIERKRETFGDAPIVRIVMLRESFDRYYAAQEAPHRADLDAMVDSGTLLLKESSG